MKNNADADIGKNQHYKNNWWKIYSFNIITGNVKNIIP